MKSSKKEIKPGVLLFILTGLNLFNYLDRYVLSAVLSPLKAELHLSDGDLGRIMTAFMVGYFVSSPFFGYLGDRASRKWLIAGGVFIWSLGTVLTGFAAGLGLLLCYRVLVGFGEASYGTISPALLADVYRKEKLNNAITIFYVAIPVGSALGYIVGGQIASHYSWREAFIWAGAPGLALALLLLPFREPARGTTEAGASHKIPSVADVLRLFKLTEYNLILLGYVAYTFALGAYAYWGPTFLHRVHGFSNEFSATFFGGVLVVTGLVGTLLGGFAATKWQKKNAAGYAWTLGLSTLLVVPLSFLAFSVASKTLVLVCMAGAMFMVFLPTGPINTLILEAVPSNLRASAMALSIFAIHLFGDMWSPEIVGRLADHWSNLQRAVMILPAAFFVGAAVWLYLAVRTSRLRAPSVMVESVAG